jgi:hypothetical protein
VNPTGTILEHVGEETTIALVEGGIVNGMSSGICPLINFTKGKVIARSAVFRKIMRVEAGYAHRIQRAD